MEGAAGRKSEGVATSLSDWSVNVLGDLEKRLNKGQERIREVEKRAY